MVAVRGALSISVRPIRVPFHPEMLVSRRRMALCCAVLLLGVGCTSRVDVARETQALLETDRAWARAAAVGRNVDSVLAYWADDARVAMPGQAVLRGKAAIRQMVASSFATPGFHVSWTPETAVVSRSGDLGYTAGSNEFTVPDSAGGVMKLPGRYLTVWRKGTDGRWRCVEDYSSPALEAPAPGK